MLFNCVDEAGPAPNSCIAMNEARPIEVDKSLGYHTLTARVAKTSYLIAWTLSFDQ